MLRRRAVYALVPLGLTCSVVGFDRLFNHVDSIAEEYVSVALAFRHLQAQPIPRPDAASLERVPTATHLTLSHARKLRRRVRFTRQLRGLHGKTWEDDAVYRLEWMGANLQTICTILDQKEAKIRLGFDEQCKDLFNTSVSSRYFTDNPTAAVHQKLAALLPPSDDPLPDRHRTFWAEWFLPKADYEPQFRRMVGDVLKMMEVAVPELQATTVRQEYFDDSGVVWEATCEPSGPGESVMKVNVARPITWCKAQQLAAHELTHHLQTTLMERHLYPQFPEMAVAPEEGPMGMLLEGGAELGVDLFFPPEAREHDLAERVPAALRSEVDKAVAVERLSWGGLWPCIISIARDFVDGRISRSEAVARMRDEALRELNSWPNVEFFEQTGAYTQGYGWGKQLIADYVKAQRPATPLDGYVAFVKRPPTPGMMADALRLNRWF